jgi:hypothetical protein
LHEKEIKAEDLAKILRIPKEKALEQIDVKPEAPELPLAAPPIDPENVAAEILPLEALIARLQELERRRTACQSPAPLPKTQASKWAMTQEKRQQGGRDHAVLCH